MLWGLVFSLANGFMEELWFRGIFLGKLQPLIGTGAATLLTALLFDHARGRAVRDSGLYAQPVHPRAGDGLVEAILVSLPFEVL